MKRRSSLRLMAWPIPPTSGDVRQLMLFSLRHLFGCKLNSLHDVLVSGAPAQIAGDTPADLLLTGRRILLQKDIRRHQHARRAIAALQPVFLFESFLKWMQRSVFAEALNRHQFAAVCLYRKHRAG